MTRDESLTIVAMIASGWPGAAWDAPRLDSYAKGIESMDALLTTQAVLRAQREVKYRPSVAELREFVSIERRLSEKDEPQERRTLPPGGKCPAWVMGWCVARYRYGDMRVWAEQDPQGLSGNLMPGDARVTYMTEGSSLSIGQVFQAMGVT